MLTGAQISGATVGGVLAVDEVDFKDNVSIQVYPNPVQNVLKINAPNAIDKIEVYNILGQKILDHKGTNQINVVDYEISSFAYEKRSIFRV